MAIRERVEKNAIEASRQKIIAATLSEQLDDRYLKKAAVRQLIGTLIAARTSGLSFEKLATLMAEGGIEIATETLRGYYFELKTEEELSAENAQHAKTVARLRKELGKDALAEDLSHAEATASNHAVRLASSRPRIDVFADDQDTQPTVAPRPAQPRLVRARPKAVPGKSGVDLAPHWEKHVAPPPPAGVTPAAPIQETGAPGTNVLSDATSAPTDVSILPQPSKFYRLEEIEAASAGKDKTELTDDLRLGEGGVVEYVSGKPFEGFLSAKQIHLLRSVGKLVAQTKGRTTKEFVEMPSRL